MAKRSSDPRVAYTEVKVQVRDLYVLVVGIVALCAPRGVSSRGKFVLIAPGGKLAKDTCARCPQQRYNTRQPGKVHDGPNIKLFILVGLGWSSFVCCLAHRGSTVVFFFFFCSSVPVVLFDTPGISRCRSQHVSVESSSLLHHSIYLWFICFPWWSIDELENLHADRTIVCFEPW